MVEVCRCVVTAPASVPVSPAIGGSVEKDAGSPSVRIGMEQKIGGYEEW